MRYCIENVVPKSRMREETLAKWNSMVPVDFAKLNAASVGAAISRPRMVSTNMVSMPEIRKKPTADPNIFLLHGKTDSRTMPCVMTCPRATWNPVMVTDRKSYGERFASTDELMGLMGYQPGALKKATPDKEKEKMMGNAFHYQLVRALVVTEEAELYSTCVQGRGSQEDVWAVLACIC